MIKAEVIKLLEYHYDDLKLRVDVRIIKWDGFYEFFLSHYYKPKDAATFYHPSSGGSSLSEIESKLDYYMSNFTADYEENSNF